MHFKSASGYISIESKSLPCVVFRQGRLLVMSDFGGKQTVWLAKCTKWLLLGTLKSTVTGFLAMKKLDAEISGTTPSQPQNKKGLPEGRPLAKLVRLAGIEPTTPWFVAMLSFLSH